MDLGKGLQLQLYFVPGNRIVATEPIEFGVDARRRGAFGKQRETPNVRATHAPFVGVKEVFQRGVAMDRAKRNKIGKREIRVAFLVPDNAGNRYIERVVVDHGLANPLVGRRRSK